MLLKRRFWKIKFLIVFCLVWVMLMSLYRLHYKRANIEVTFSQHSLFYFLSIHCKNYLLFNFLLSRKSPFIGIWLCCKWYDCFLTQCYSFDFIIFFYYHWMHLYFIIIISLFLLLYKLLIIYLHKIYYKDDELFYCSRSKSFLHF